MLLTSEQKILCTISHLGIFVGFPILAPLLVYFLTKDEYIKVQAKEGLVFQICIVLALVCSIFFMFSPIGIILFIFFAIIALVLPITAIIKLCQGVDFSYPICGRLINRTILDQKKKG